MSLAVDKLSNSTPFSSCMSVCEVISICHMLSLFGSTTRQRNIVRIINLTCKVSDEITFDSWKYMLGICLFPLHLLTIVDSDTTAISLKSPLDETHLTNRRMPLTQKERSAMTSNTLSQGTMSNRDRNEIVIVQPTTKKYSSQQEQTLLQTRARFEECTAAEDTQKTQQ